MNMAPGLKNRHSPIGVSAVLNPISKVIPAIDCLGASPELGITIVVSHDSCLVIYALLALFARVCCKIHTQPIAVAQVGLLR